jgi:hypothetical protein
MTRMGEFRKLKVETNNEKNGQSAIWTVSFDAIAKVENDDLFALKIPKTIKTPTDPICEPVSCIKLINKDGVM